MKGVINLQVDINYLAVLTAAISSMVTGGLWYGPLFSKKWIAYMGWNPAEMEQRKKAATKGYMVMFIGSLLMAYVLAHALVFAGSYLKASGASAGLMVGFWNWLGFVAPITIGAVLWEGRPWGLFFLNAGYQLLNLLVMGVILALWK